MNQARAALLQDFHGGLLDDQTATEAWLGLAEGKAVEMPEGDDPARPRLQKAPEIEALRTWADEVEEAARAGRGQDVVVSAAPAPLLDELGQQVADERAGELKRGTSLPDPLPGDEELDLAGLLGTIEGDDLTMEALLAVGDG